MSEVKVAKSDLKIPKFASEAEEARWWYENEELIAEEFEKAAKEGRLRTGGIRRLFRERGIPFPEERAKVTPTTTIRLDPDDIALARKQAEARGLRYQTYLKMIIHEALRKAEENKSAAA
jgi:predicted metal-dependent hydrolase